MIDRTKIESENEFSAPRLVDALAVMLLAMSLASCGGGGGSGGGTNPPVNPSPPSPSPPPAPPPAPPPPPPAPATVTFLHKFRPDLGDGGQPNGPLLQATDGNFYGTTRSGGTKECRPILPIPCGVIFKMAPDGTESVFYNFGSVADDGYTPGGPLIQGQDGALYGLTTNGGEYGGGGTAFKITLDGTYTVLHSFGGTPEDGIVPIGGLIQATDGNFYGVTASGGANHCIQVPQGGGNCGTVFRMTPGGATTILYSFGASISDGVTPLASLVQASDGNFYGTTLNGGANACSLSGATNNCGTIFRTMPSGDTSILHHFGAPGQSGSAPQGALIQGNDGVLYGTTVGGGGTVFRITLAGNFTTVYAFAVSSPLDGDGPSQYLIQARDGNIYGTTGSGGAFLGSLNGTAFRLAPAGALTTLYSFGPLNDAPSNPVGGLIEANDGAFYGITAYSGGVNGAGNVFKLVLN